MFIGHLPAGYILTKKLQKKFKIQKYLFLGLLASILPDIDLLYFYFIDKRKHLHHGYWIHVPFYWLIISIITILIFWLFKKRNYIFASIIFFANIFLHLFLDTIVGKIDWLYPFSEKPIYFFEVPNVYNFWIYNFVFHWTFLFEIAVIIWAIIIFVKTKKSK